MVKKNIKETKKSSIAQKSISHKPTASVKNKKNKDVDYFTLSLFIIIMGLLVFLAFNPQIINFNKEKNVTEIVTEETSYIYNGFTVENQGGIWVTQIEKNGLLYNIMTENGPKEVEDINISYNHNLFPALTHRGDTLYLSFDHNKSNASDIVVAGIDFAKGLSTVFYVNVKRACIQNNTEMCEIIQNCNSTDKAVIEIIRSDEPRAEYEGNCLRVYGKDQDLIKVVNRVMFEWYGIIKVDETTGKVYTI